MLFWGEHLWNGNDAYLVASFAKTKSQNEAFNH